MAEHINAIEVPGENTKNEWFEEVDDKQYNNEDKVWKNILNENVTQNKKSTFKLENNGW